MMVGVLDLGDPAAEAPAVVASRVTAALAHVAPERLVTAPACGMKYLPRDVAFGKLVAMFEATRQVRARL